MPSAYPVAWFDDFRTYARDTIRLIELTHTGVHQIQRALDVHRILSEGRPLPEPEKEHAARARLESDSALAAEEIASDFRLMHSHSLVGLWGALEAMVDGLAESLILETRLNTLSRPIFSRIKLPVSTYTALDAEARATHLVEEVKQQTASDLRAGIGQFEVLLKELRLGGPVNDAIRKTLYIAQQYRNLIAHRAGKVDDRFLRNCPEEGLAVGEYVNLSSERFGEFNMSMALYSRTLLNRLRIANGFDTWNDHIPDEYVSGPGFRESPTS